MDPSLEEAARVAGASGRRTFFGIFLPLLTPAILGATMYSFMTHLESLEVPLVIGLPARIHVFPTYIFYTTQRYTPPEYGLSAGPRGQLPAGEHPPGLRVPLRHEAGRALRHHHRERVPPGA